MTRVPRTVLLPTLVALLAGVLLVVGWPMTTSATTAAGPEIDAQTDAQADAQTDAKADAGASVSGARDARAARGLDGFPTETTAGVPRGWQPKRTREGDLFITRDGAHVRDLRLIGGDLYIEADNVGLVVKGGGYPFRLGMPGEVRNLNIVQDSWEYGPIDVACSELSEWDAQIVRLVAGGTKARTVRNQRCNTHGGN